MNPTTETMAAITVEPPGFDIEVVAETVAREFALHGSYSQLVSERDQNFCLKTTDGEKFVIKITGLAEERTATDFQIAVLNHIEECGLSCVPRIVRTVRGEKRSTITYDDGPEYCLRVVTWLRGRLLSDVEMTTDVAARFGRRLAEMDLALKSFVCDGDGQAGLWDMQEASQLSSLLLHVVDEKVRYQVERVLSRFDKSVGLALANLPRQVIHNDANPENVLVDTDGMVSGFIDFGDALKAPRIIELATAAAYLRTGGEDPVQFIRAFIAGYHQRSPLSDAEFSLLFDLIRTRLSMTLIILHWRLKARDEDDPYRQKTLERESDAFEFLIFLTDLGRDAFSRYLTEIITGVGGGSREAKHLI